MDDSRIGRWLPAGLVLVAAIGAAVIVMSPGARTAGGDQPPVKAGEEQAGKEGSSIDTASASAGSGVGAGAAGEAGSGADADRAAEVAENTAAKAASGASGVAGGRESGDRTNYIQIDETRRKLEGRIREAFNQAGGSTGEASATREGVETGPDGRPARSGVASVSKTGALQEGSRPASPAVAQRPVNRIPLDLPESTAVEPPPPPGFARLRTGSIPVERSLLLDGAEVSSFTLYKRVFEPGQHRVRLESARGCVEFNVDLKSDEIVYLIWDFEQGGWRRHERVGGSRTSLVSPSVASCGGGR